MQAVNRRLTDVLHGSRCNNETDGWTPDYMTETLLRIHSEHYLQSPIFGITWVNMAFQITIMTKYCSQKNQFTGKTKFNTDLLVMQMKKLTKDCNIAFPWA